MKPRLLTVRLGQSGKEMDLLFSHSSPSRQSYEEGPKRDIMFHFTKNIKYQKGFTLIELLVVISIIGLVSSVLLIAINNTRIKSRDTKRKADLKQLNSAINFYYNNNGYLPRNSSGWCTTISNPSNGWGDAFQADITSGVIKYMAKVPLDPKLANQVGDYFYSNDNNTQGRFALCAVLEQSSGATMSTNRNMSGCANWTNAYNYCISQ